MKFFGVPLSSLAQVETALGDHLIRAEVVRIQIETLRHEAEREGWHLLAAMVAVGLLIGAVVGCMTVAHLTGK